MNFDDFIGSETLNKEHKCFSFHKSGMNIDISTASSYCENNQFTFNHYVISNIKKYIKLYLPKYVCGYLNSNLNKGDFYIGINDFGFVKGIPYQGKLSLEFIKQYINKTITNYIKGSKIDNSMIEVELINVNKPDIPIYNQNPKYTEYLEKKKEYLEKYSDFLQKYKEWEQKYDIFNHKLIEIYNNKETRAMLIEYVKKHDPENCVLELLYSDYQMKYNEDDYVKELKLDKNHSYYWITHFKDDEITNIRKERPIFIKDFNHYNVPINLIISVNDMIPYWMNHNVDMNLYVIHIKILNNNNNNNIYEYRDYHNKDKWIKCQRYLLPNGQPSCSPF